MVRQVLIVRGVLAFVIAASVPALAKKDPAKDKAASNADFAKLVAKWENARKAGPLTAVACANLAKEFDGFADDKKSAEAYFNSGVILESCGNMKDAQSAYKDALSINPKFAPAIVNLGEIAYRQGDTATAEMQFTSAQQADAKNVQAYNGLALILFERARQNSDKAMMDDAIGKLRRALAVDATSMPAYTLLALIYYTRAESDRSKLDLAELVCTQAKETNDKYPQIYNVLGLIKLKKKNVTGALQEFKSAAQLEPRYIEAQLNIGAITLSVRDYKSAEEAFKAVLDARPTNPTQLYDATMGMGVALRGQRRIDEAEQWYAKAKALNPRDCAIPYNLGVLYQDYRGNPDTDLSKAKDFFGQYVNCGKADAEKLKDATRRMKDIDDTFKAIAEAKKLEEENKKMLEEAKKMEEEQQRQLQQQQQQEQNQNKGEPKPGEPKGDAPPKKDGAPTPGGARGEGKAGGEKPPAAATNPN